MKQQSSQKRTDQDIKEDREDTAVGPLEKIDLAAKTGKAEFDEFGPNWIYDNTQEATVNCRKLLLLYLFLLSYALLSTLTTPAQNLFLEQNVTMPIIDFSVPIEQYLLLTPLISIGFFIYIQIYLRKVNIMASFAITTCKQRHPDCDLGDLKYTECSFNKICVLLQNRFYPWMFIYSRYSHEKIIRFLQRLFFICSLWFFLPITLFAVSLFIVKTHDARQFYFLLFWMVAGFLLVFFFWRFQLDLNFSFKTNFIKKKDFIFFTLLLALSAVLISFHMQGKNGRLWWVQDSVWKENAGRYSRFMRAIIFADLRDKQLVTKTIENQTFNLVMREVHFEGANLSNTYLAKTNFTEAHLQYANLKETTLNDSVLTLANLSFSNLGGSKLIGTNLIGARMDGCDLVQAKLIGASLNTASLQYANLSHADLKNTSILNADIYLADFRGAENTNPDQIKEAKNWQFAYYDKEVCLHLGLPENHNENLAKRELKGYPLNGIGGLGKAAYAPSKNTLDLSGYDLTMSTLSEASLEGANLEGTNLQYADLLRAYLSGAKLKRADLKYAILSNTSLSGADLKEANLKDTDLSHADLIKANLKGADLTSAKLDGAKVQWADFRGTKGLTVMALKKAQFYALAYYDADIIDQLGLEPNHNDRLKQKNLSDYEFSKFEGNLAYADFSAMSLKSAHFQQVDLTGANFRKASLNQADFNGADLKKADFYKADLDGSIMNGANVRWVDFRSAKNVSSTQLKTTHGHQLAKYDTSLLRELDLPNKHNDLLQKKILAGYDLNSAKLAEAVLNKFDLRKTTFVKADLTNAVFDKANLQDADLSQATLKEASFKETILEEAKLIAADLSGATLDDADLQYADMRRVSGLTLGQLQKADNYHLARYDQVFLENLDLPSDHNSNLEAKKFHHYKFVGVSLKKADLVEFELVDADLSDADLRWANLSRANLCRANLRNTDFRYANLRGIGNCGDIVETVAQFANVKSLYQTKLDPDLKQKLETAYPNLFENPDWVLSPNSEKPLRITRFF